MPVKKNPKKASAAKKEESTLVEIERETLDSSVSAESDDVKEKPSEKETEKTQIESDDKKASVSEENKNGLRPTGIDELDIMLGGGLPEKATVLLSGDAGVGKTTLAMQWLFDGYAKYQETGIYITLTEPTTVAIQNLKGKTFFNKDNIASSDMNASQVESEIASRPGIHFVDLRQILEEMKLLKTEYSYKDIDKIHDVLFGLVMNAGVSRVVIDSITAIAYLLGDKNLIRTFIYKMGKFLALSNANTLLVGEASNTGNSVFGVEEFISDGVIELRYVDDGVFPVRTLKIKKMRGIGFDSRVVTYKITSAGVRLFLQDKKSLTHKASSERVATGIEGFDKLISGGLIAESAVLVSGPSGGGKTLFSMQAMVESLKQGKKCIYISHEESRHQIIRNGLSFGWELEKYEKEGLLKVETPHPDQMHIDELVYGISKIVRDFSPSLVIVDSLTAMANLYEEKVVHDWVSQLTAIFKKNKALSMFLSATTNLVGESVASNVGISSLFDQIIMLRYVEVDSEFHHAILVIKMRGSAHDKKMYKIEFSDVGLKITNSFSGYEGVFSGNAKHISKSKEERLRSVFLEILGPMGEEIFEEQKEKGLKMNNIEVFVNDLSKEGILDRKKETIFLNEIMRIFKGEV